MDNVFTSGELVPYSGVYRITHCPPHTSEECLTLAKESTFPLCVHCSHVSFMLVNKLSGSGLDHFFTRIAKGLPVLDLERESVDSLRLLHRSGRSVQRALSAMD